MNYIRSVILDAMQKKFLTSRRAFTPFYIVNGISGLQFKAVCVCVLDGGGRNVHGSRVL